MSAAERITVELTAEAATFVRRAVESGEYASSDEVVQEALARLKDDSGLFGYPVEELRRLVQEGIDSGPGTDAEVVMDELRARVAKSRT